MKKTAILISGLLRKFVNFENIKMNIIFICVYKQTHIK
jgi:hypothetical protein